MFLLILFIIWVVHNVAIGYTYNNICENCNLLISFSLFLLFQYVKCLQCTQAFIYLSIYHNFFISNYIIMFCFLCFQLDTFSFLFYFDYNKLVVFVFGVGCTFFHFNLKKRLFQSQSYNHIEHDFCFVCFCVPLKIKMLIFITRLI